MTPGVPEGVELLAAPDLPPVPGRLGWALGSSCSHHPKHGRHGAHLSPKTKDVQKAMDEKRFDEAIQLRGR